MSTANKDTEFSITERLSKTERYIEDNKKSLGIIVGVVLLLVIGYLAYIKFIVGPAEEKARGQMFTAERYFEQDSLKKAIDGDGNFPGFKQIIEDYGSTKTGNLARLHAGTVMAQRVTQTVFDFALVLARFHVDEVDDDQPPQVTQAQLPGDFIGGFAVSAQCSFFDVAATRGTTGVHVN